MNSMLNYNTRNSISQNYLTKVINYHQELPAFARRPFTNYFTNIISDFFSIKLGTSFIILNFFFLTISSYLIYYLSLILNNNQKLSYLNIIFFFLSFSILFAFFPPIFSYDEPIQYFFIILSFIGIIKEKWSFYIVFFSLGIIARESSLILLPGFFFISRKDHFQIITKLKHLLLLASPIVIYLIYLFIYFKYNNTLEETIYKFSDRLSPFVDNFREQDLAITSIISFFLVTSFPLYFTYIILQKKKNNKLKYINAFLITLFINTIVVFVTTKSREARLFALPLFFLWPIYSFLIFDELKKIFNWSLLINTFKNWKRISIYTIFIFINYIISYRIFLPDENKLFVDNYFHEYLFITFSIIITHSFINNYTNDEFYITTKI